MSIKNLIVALGAFLLSAIIVYAMAIEPARLTLTKISLSEGHLARVLAGRTVVLLSDLHFSDTGEPLGAVALQRLSEIRPDLILIAGDFVEWGSGSRAYGHALDFLARVEAPLGVYAVLGDADTTNSRKSCEFCHEPGSGAPTVRHNVVFLRNESRMIDLPVGKLRIVGFDAGLPRPSPSRSSLLLAGEIPTILLSHSSIVYKAIDRSQEVLTVSGDTHGGQIRLPRWFWRITRFKPDPEHLHGYFSDGRKSLIVTRGIGTSRLRFRLGAPPEIVVLQFAGEPR